MGRLMCQAEGMIIRDGERRPLPRVIGTARMAINYKRGNGEEEPTIWISLVGFSDKADKVAALKKGQIIRASGRMIHKSYKDKNGADRVSYDLFVDDAEVVGRGRQPDGKIPPPDPDDIIPF